jgi:hypothetical protein
VGRIADGSGLNDHELFAVPPRRAGYVTYVR